MAFARDSGDLNLWQVFLGSLGLPFSHTVVMTLAVRTVKLPFLGRSLVLRAHLALYTLCLTLWQVLLCPRVTEGMEVVRDRPVI